MKRWRVALNDGNDGLYIVNASSMAVAVARAIRIAQEEHGPLPGDKLDQSDRDPDDTYTRIHVVRVPVRQTKEKAPAGLTSGEGSSLRKETRREAPFSPRPHHTTTPQSRSV